MQKIGRNWSTPESTVEFEACKARILFEQPHILVRDGQKLGLALADECDAQLEDKSEHEGVPTGLGWLVKLVWVSRISRAMGLSVAFVDRKLVIGWKE